VPPLIAVLTVQLPDVLGADEPEFRDRHLTPFMGRLKRRPLFEQDDGAPCDAVAEAYLVADFRRNPRLAERSKAASHFGLLDLG